jgi:hypothetical protein
MSMNLRWAWIAVGRLSGPCRVAGFSRRSYSRMGAHLNPTEQQQQARLLTRAELTFLTKVFREMRRWSQEPLAMISGLNVRSQYPHVYFDMEDGGQVDQHPD